MVCFCYVTFCLCRVCLSTKDGCDLDGNRMRRGKPTRTLGNGMVATWRATRKHWITLCHCCGHLQRRPQMVILNSVVSKPSFRPETQTMISSRTQSRRRTKLDTVQIWLHKLQQRHGKTIWDRLWLWRKPKRRSRVNRCIISWISEIRRAESNWNNG